MRYIMTLLWSVILVSMLNYVVSSILGAPFDFQLGLKVAVVFTVLIFILGAIIPNEPTPEADHH